MQCPTCGYEMGPFDVECERCRRMAKDAKTAPPAPQPKPLPPVETRAASLSMPTPRQQAASPDQAAVASSIVPGILWSVGVLLLGVVLFLGNYHIVTSEDGTTLVHKVEFTFAEPFVSVSAITGMPFIQAKEKYPLGVKALQRAGILETDEEFDRRIEEETQRKIREATDDFNRRFGL